MVRRHVSHAAAALSPFRLGLLQGLQQPDSASGLARRMGLPRQQVNYHLRELERAGFIEMSEERQRRGLTERIMRLTSRVSFPRADEAAPEAQGHDFASAHLIAAASAVASEGSSGSESVPTTRISSRSATTSGVPANQSAGILPANQPLSSSIEAVPCLFMAVRLHHYT